VTFRAQGEVAKKGLAFYPASDKVQVTTWNSQGTRTDDGPETALVVHMMGSQKDPAHVPFLVSYEEKGERRGFFVEVDLSAARAGK
jgi:hypothetical protein